MDREKIALAMPAIRQEFESLKQALGEGRMPSAASALFGGCLSWGDELRSIYARDDRQALSGRDPLTRFFVTRFRGQDGDVDIVSASGGTCFLLAFSAFPYLDALMTEMSVGDHMGFDEDGNWLVSKIIAGTMDGSRLKVDKGHQGWRFDLMSVYQTKAQAMDTFINERFGGDFDAFLWRYVADHDLAFDMERAWRPLVEKGGI